MTIGIAAIGPNAGKAVFDALAAVESIGRGAIGGFVTYAAITIEDELLRHETQRGGTTTLFTDGEETGTPPTKIIAQSPMAALMSSGPDRPEPLSQFVAASTDAGIVTGHRLPNALGISGIAINQEVLDLMHQGQDAAHAVYTVLSENPMADVGLIAMDKSGKLYSENSQRVLNRPDLGQKRLEKSGAVVEVLHNAIHPVEAIANLAANIAMETMMPTQNDDGWIIVNAGLPVTYGPEDSVLVDANGTALQVITTDERIISGVWNCAAIYLGAKIVQDGSVLGLTTFEPNVVVKDGRIESMSGQTSLRLGYGKLRLEPWHD